MHWKREKLKNIIIYYSTPDLLLLLHYSGFEGKNCEININECLQSGCQEQELGVKYCVDRINDYQCVCEDGFTGKNCQINKGRLSQLIF